MHKLSDELAGAAAEQEFDAFIGFFSNILASLVRVRAGGTGAAEDRQLAGRLIEEHRVKAFAETVTELQKAHTECKALNLDRKQLIVGTVTRLAALAGR